MRAADGGSNSTSAAGDVLSDAQMGLTDGERKLLRATAVVKVLGANGWERLGRGDVLLAHHESKAQARLVFVTQAGPSLNAWLFRGMRNERVQERSLAVRACLGWCIMCEPH
jgi:hypothetical protein